MWIKPREFPSVFVCNSAMIALSMRSLFRSGFFLGLSLLFFCFGSLSRASASVITVCGSALVCDHTSISNALTAATANDTIEVQGGGGSPYSSVGETWPLQFRSASTTIACTGGATITQSTPSGPNYINLSTSSTVRDCTFGNVQLASIYAIGAEGQSPAGIQILNNAFSASATSTIGISNAGATDFLIDGNTNVGFLQFASYGTSTRGVISNNTFRNRITDSGYQAVSLLVTGVSTTNLTVKNNVFDNYMADVGSQRSLLDIAGVDIVFATNTVRYPVPVTSGSFFTTSITWTASGTRNYIGGNFIEAPTFTSDCSGITISSVVGEPAWNSIIDIYHNTIRMGGSVCATDNGAGIIVAYIDLGTVVTSTINAFYNLIDNESPTTTFTRAIYLEYTPGSTINQTNDYNGAYGFSATVTLREKTPGGLTTDVSGLHSKTTKPFLMTADADATNDFIPAPFSDYLDVDGTDDIGAATGTRRSTVYIDDTGIINYGAVDATTTLEIPYFLRTGDTVNLAAGTYRAFSVNSSSATSSITVQGAGISTIIDVLGAENGLLLTNVSSTTISNLWVRNASSTGSASYTITRINGKIGLQEYNEALAPMGLSSDVMVVFPQANSCDDNVFVSSDGYDITSVTGSGTSGFHLVLASLFGSHITVLLPSSEFANQAAFEAFFLDFCGEVITVDAFADNIFTVSDGVYSYDAGSLASAGAALAAGVTDPPSITTTPGSRYAGIKLAGSSNHVTISNVTSTSNGYGIWFATTANGYNTLSESDLASNTLYDVLSASGATNTFDNVGFTRTSSSVTGAGPVLVKFKVRGETLRSVSGTPIATVTATATDGLGAATVLGATDASGLSAFSSVPAYEITSLSSALTNGGYNPYVLDAGAISGYGASTTNFTLSSKYQTATLRLLSTSVPSAPTSASVSFGTTTSTMEWVDNADDETAFVTDIINLSVGESFPGTTSTAAVDATSYAFTSLTPNMTYQVRVQATSTNGGSSYLTSSAFTTYAATPSAPTVAALSGTSVSVTINPNGNSTSTKYALYSSTLGGYLSALGVASDSPTWQTTSTWSALTVSSLTCATSYSFSVIGRNLDLVLTATSTAGVVSTSACPTTSSGGGGGGGGGATSAGSSSGGVPATFSYLPSSTVLPDSSPVPTPPAPIIPPPASPTPPPPPPSSPRLRLAVTDDARAFGVSLSERTRERLASFIEHGTTDATRRLGEGERRALVRDLLDTMQRDRITQEDLERVASGQIPLQRNLDRERVQLPRVQGTFRSIYRHNPDFQNPEENLAWNTLMYRIRFPRDLVAEREGIADFRRIFGRLPSDPFQWATVRVAGYVSR